MSADNEFFESLLWAALYQIDKDEVKHMELFNKLRIKIYDDVNREYYDDYEPEVYNRLSNLYGNAYFSSFDAQLFVQNKRYQSEFDNCLLLGTGSFGTVYKVRNIIDGQNYAVKRQIVNDEKSIDRIKNEIKIISSMNNDYLLNYKSLWFEFDELNNCTLSYIQMDLCVITLARAIDLINQIESDREKDQVKLVELRKIKNFISCSLFYEILQGVNFLHSCDTPIIHRDLKPSNIMLSDGKNGRFVKITDFGLSTFHVLDNESHTEKCGTKEYKAPEVCRGTKYNTKADMFSIGMILSNLFSIRIDSDSDSENIESGEINKINTDYMKKLVKELTNLKPETRPSSYDIISEKSEWFYEFDQIRELDTVKQICDKTDHNYELETDFKEYFLYQKQKATHNQISLSKSKETKFSMELNKARHYDEPEIIAIYDKNDQVLIDTVFSVALNSIKVDHKSCADIAKHVTETFVERYYRMYGKRFITIVGLKQNYDLFYTRGPKRQERKFIRFSIGNIAFSIYQV